MKTLRRDGGGEFISHKLRLLCEKQGIAIRYAAPYVNKENGLAERGWRTIVTMKDSLLIDSGLPNDFWAETVGTANYLRNRLSTRSKNHGKMIPEESWTGRRQDLQHVRIFGSLVLANIPEEKRSKSDYQKVWQGILIGYSIDTTKHFRVWAPQTKQVIIASEPYIDGSEQGAKLLDKWPLDTPSSKKKAPAGEPRPRGRPRKQAIEIASTTRIAEPLAGLEAPIPPPDTVIETPNKEISSNTENRDASHEVAMPITESYSKINEPTS